MAFNKTFINYLVQSTNLVDSRPEAKKYPKKLASIGYPDILVKKPDTDSDFPISLLKYLSCNEKALDWHNLSSSMYTFFSVEDYLKDKCWAFDYLDIKAGTGKARNFLPVDLNESIPENLYCAYDILIDSGTAEHCFNIGKVFENYFHMLKPGGILLQYIPFMSPNHGFWSVNPTVVYDLASCNPIKILDCKLHEYASYHDYFECNHKDIRFEPVRRFGVKLQANSVSIVFFAYKKLQKSIFRFPIQYKYRMPK